MRAAAFGVMVVALAAPGYLAYQDEAPFREGLDAITPRLDAPSGAVQSTEPPPQAMPVDDPTARPRETTPVQPTLHDADATRESPSQPAHIAIETPPPPPKAESNSKSPQAGKNVRSKQGSSSRKAVKPKAADARNRAKSSDAQPPEPKEKAASSEIMP
jgi:hypothetical protein